MEKRAGERKRPESVKAGICREVSGHSRCREPNPNRGQQWQHLDPLAAGLEEAGWLKTDICQVNSVGALCAEARGRKSPSASFPWLQVTVSQFVFFPHTTLGAPFSLKRAERKF